MGSEAIEEAGKERRTGIGAPLRAPLFRRMWLASLMSNLGIMILSVGAAWAMTQLTNAADMIALVQSSLMFPMMLIAMPAGAIADMYDRRRVGLIAIGISLLGASALSLITASGALNPWLLLIFVFLVGIGIALFWPTWQASAGELAPAEHLAQAVALNSISFNVARSIGPAIGGVIVAIAGAVAAFSANALLFIPLLLVLFRWRRVQEPSRLPPERLAKAISSGARFVFHSPPQRAVLLRSFAHCLAGSAIMALMPVVARDLLHGNALVYGVILGAFGVGAVIGALNISVLRERFDLARAPAVLSLGTAAMIAVVAVSGNLILTAGALLVMGATWMVLMTLFNISIQLSAPRWVTARAVGAFQTSTSGGIAIGSWLWGHVAQGQGIVTALLGSAVAVGLTVLLGRRLPDAAMRGNDLEPVELGTPEVALALKGRSGPIVIEVEYRVDRAEARAFYDAMQQIQRMRQRNGAYDWSIARDITDPELWTERYHCPTWHDYLRLRGRYTTEDMATLDRAYAFHRDAEPPRVLRRLERPFGSVRWREDAPDRGTEVMPIASPLANG